MGDWVTVGGNEDSTTWDQKQPLEGTYQYKKTDIGPNNSNMYMIDTDDGQVGVWGSTVIDSKFEQIQPGVKVRIEFDGMKKGRTGNQYKDYRIQYEQPSGMTSEDILKGQTRLEL